MIEIVNYSCIYNYIYLCNLIMIIKLICIMSMSMCREITNHSVPLVQFDNFVVISVRVRVQIIQGRRNNVATFMNVRF